MKKYFVFFLFFPVLLWSATTTTTTIGIINVSRTQTIGNARQYLRLYETWTPSAREREATENGNTATYPSWYNTSRHHEYRNPFPAEDASETDRIIGAGDYDVVPYARGGFDDYRLIKLETESGDPENPEWVDVKTEFGIPTGYWCRKKYLPACPGGNNTTDFRDDLGGESAYDYVREYLAGIDCIGFILRSWGFDYMLNDEIRSSMRFSLPVADVTNMRPGDFFATSDHVRLFVRPDESRDNFYVTYESTGSSGIQDSLDGVQGDGRYPGVVAWEYFTNDLKGYDCRTPFPQFVIPAIGKTMETTGSVFTIEIKAGVSVSDIQLSRVQESGQYVAVPTTTTTTVFYTDPASDWGNSWKHHKVLMSIYINEDWWVSRNSTTLKNLKRVSFSLSANNTFYYGLQAGQPAGGGEIGTSPMRDPSGHIILTNNKVSFYDETNFTFYRFLNNPPPHVSSIVVTRTYQNTEETVAWYNWVWQSDGSCDLVGDYCIDADRINLSEGSLKYYVQFSDDMKCTLAEKPILYLIGYNSSTSPNNPIQYALTALFDRTETGNVLKEIKLDSINIGAHPEVRKYGDSEYYWYVGELSTPGFTMDDIVGFAISGNSEDADLALDQNPSTTPVLNGPDSWNGNTIIFDNSEPTYLLYQFNVDKSAPQLTYFKVEVEGANRGEWDLTAFNNNRFGIRSSFQDISIKEQDLELTIKVSDDKKINGSETYVFLIPENKYSQFESWLYAYRLAYANGAGMDKLVLMYSFINTVLDLNDNGIDKIIGMFSSSSSTTAKLAASQADLEYNNQYIIPLIIRGKRVRIDGNHRIDIIQNTYFDWSQTSTSSPIISEFNPILSSDQLSFVGEGRYRIAVLVTDPVGNKLTFTASGGGVTRDSEGNIYTYMADDPAATNTNDIVLDGCFLSPTFAVDNTPPTFEFSLGGVFSNFTQGLTDLFKLAICDELSRDVNVILTSKDRDSGEELMRVVFTIHGVDQLAKYFANTNDASVDWSKVTIDCAEGFPGVTVSFDAETRKFDLEWDIWNFLMGTGQLTAGLKGVFTVTLEDNAGNSWFDGFKEIDLAGIALDAAVDALKDALGISDKSIILCPGFSVGGIEIDPAKYLLIGMGVNGRSVPIFPNELENDCEEAIAKIRREIADFQATSGGGVIVTAWGNGGIPFGALVIQMTNEAAHGNIESREFLSNITKYIKVGVPNGGGYNSISQAIESYSLYLTLAPILNLLTSSGANDAISGVTGVDIESTVKDVIQNDDIINPMNFIGLLLGQANAALAMDANSEVIQQLNDFEWSDAGIETESVRTALWPDMPVEVQVGIVAVSSIAAYAGLYSGVELFSLDSSIFNNIDERLGEIAADYIEGLLQENIYDPLKAALELEVRKLVAMGFEAGEDLTKDLVNSVMSNAGIDADFDTIVQTVLEVQETLNAIKRFTEDTPADVRQQAFDALTNAICNMPGIQSGYEDFRANYGTVLLDFNEWIQSNGMVITNYSSIVSNYVGEGRSWLSGEALYTKLVSALSNGENPEWVQKTIPNYDAMIAQLAKDIYTQVMDVAFREMGVPNLREQLDTYLSKAEEISGQVNTITTTVMNVSSRVATIVENTNIFGFMNDFSATADVDELRTNSNYIAFINFVDSFTSVVQGDVASLLSYLPEGSGTNGSFDIVARYEDLKEEPVRLVMNLYERGTGYLNAATKKLITDNVSSLVRTILPMQALSALNVRVSIPQGVPGAIIMGVVSFLATDYIKNTDLRSEGQPLLLTKVFGLTGGQTGDGITSGSFMNAASDGDMMMNMIANDHPRVIISEMNGMPLSAFNVERGPEGIEAMMSVDANSGTARIDTVTQVKVNQFINSIEGVVNDSLPQMLKLYVSVNYGEFRELPLDESGRFKLSGIRMIEGLNNFTFCTRAVYSDAIYHDESGEEKAAGEPYYISFDVILDMMPPQAFPVWPALNQVLNLNNNDQPIMIGLYNSDAGSEFNNDSVTVSVRRMNIPWVSSPLTNYYDTWTVVDDYDVAEASDNTWKVSFRLDTYNNQYPEGQYAVKIESVDNVGNKSTSVLGFYNDTTPPEIDIREIAHLNGSQNLKVAYYIKDTPTPLLRGIDARVDGGLVSTRGLCSVGPQGLVTDMSFGDGRHTFSVIAVDQAGNAATNSRYFYVDTRPPSLNIVENEMQGVINSEENDYNVRFVLRDQDNSILTNEAYFRMILQNKNDNRRYYSGALIEQYRMTNVNSHMWTFRDPFQNVDDGAYSVLISGADYVGNVTAVITNDLIIDRTAPVIYQAYAMPYIIPSINGSNVIYYKLSEDDDASMNRGEVTVKIDIYDKYTGLKVDTITDAPNLTDGSQNMIVWNGQTNGVELPEGTYDFVVRAVDQYGNIAARYIETVKGGIKPLISSPREYNTDGALVPVSVAGNVGISGVAKDPIWDNRQEFLNYAIYIMSNKCSIPSDLSDSWLISQGWGNANGALWVPEINRMPGGSVNVSYRTVENDALLAYLETENKLSNGIYTLLLVAREQNGSALLATTGDPYVLPGAMYADISYIRVSNPTNGEPLNPDITNGDPSIYPAVVNLFGSYVDTTNFVADGYSSVKLAYNLGLQNVDGADVSFGVYDIYGRNIYNKTLFNLTGKPYVSLTTNVNRGYVVYQTNDGWHVLMLNDNSQEDRFSGKIEVLGSITALSHNFIPSEDSGITYRTFRELSFAADIESLTNGEPGSREIVFNGDIDRIRFELYVNDKADPGLIFYNNGSNPTLQALFSAADFTNSQLASYQNDPYVNKLTNAVSFWLENARPAPPFSWRGYDTYGAFVEAGEYYFVLTAAGRDGRGFDKETFTGIRVTSPLSVTNNVSPSGFDPFSEAVNETTLSFKTTKKATVTIDVVSEDTIVCPLVNAQEVQGNLWYQLSYDGSKDFMGSPIILDNGDYDFRIIARDLDGSGITVTNFAGFSITNETYNPGLVAFLNVDGTTNSDGIVSVNGDARFRWRLSGVTGNYYHPMRVAYRVRVRGTQTVVGYPFVPFVTEARRWYEGVRLNNVAMSFITFRDRLGDNDSDIVEGTNTQSNLEMRLKSPNGEGMCFSTSPGHFFVIGKPRGVDAIRNPRSHFMINVSGQNIALDLGVIFTNENYSFGYSDWTSIGASGMLSNVFQVKNLYLYTYPLGPDSFRHVMNGWIRLNPNVLDNTFPTANFFNRYTQWASENKFFYGGRESSQSLTPSAETTNNSQNPVYGSSLNQVVLKGNVADENGFIHTISWTNYVLYGYVNRYVNNVTNNFQNYSSSYGGGGRSLYFENESELLGSEHFIFNTDIGSIEVTNSRIVYNIAVITNFVTNAQSNVIISFIKSTNLSRVYYVTNVNVNSAYGVSFYNYPNTRVYEARTSIYDFVYNGLPFPATINDVAQFNADNQETVGGEQAFTKYNFEDQNTLLHPSQSFINYGGRGVSYNDYTNIIMLSPENNNYTYLTNFILQNYRLYTTGNGLEPRFDGDTGVPANFHNINPTNLIVEIFSVEPLDDDFADNSYYNSTNSIRLIASLSNYGEVSLGGVGFSTSWNQGSDPVFGWSLDSGTNAICDKEFTDKAKNFDFQDALMPVDTSVNNRGIFWITSYISNNIVHRVPSNNPWLVLNTSTISATNIKLYYLNGMENTDLYVSNVTIQSSGRDLLTGNFNVALRPGLEGKKIVEIRGTVSSRYELLYYDGTNMNSFVQVNTNSYITNGPLGYWDVSGLSGRYTLVLKAFDNDGVRYARQVVDIGEYVTPESREGVSGHFIASTPYKRVELVLPSSIPDDTLVNVTAVSLNEMSESDFGGSIPDITPIGPILRMEPSPYDFGDDAANWPTITAKFSREEADLYHMLDASPCLYTITENGIEALNTTVLYLKWDETQQPSSLIESSRDEFDLLQLTASASHFSYFFVLNNTNFGLPAPVIQRSLISNYILPQAQQTVLDLFAEEKPVVYYTKEDTFDVVYRALADRDTVCYVDVDRYLNNESAAVLSGSPVITISPNAGYLTNYSTVSNNGVLTRSTNIYNAYLYAITNVALHEGTNFVIVKYDMDNSPMDYIIVLRDSEGAQFVDFNASEYVSPNSDGYYDKFMADYLLNKLANVRFDVMNNRGATLYSEFISNSITNSIVWDCTIENTGEGRYKYIVADGIYDYRVTALDSIGNVSEGFVQSVIVDTKSPTLELNQDKIILNQSRLASVYYTADEPVCLNLEIYNRDGEVVNTIEISDYNREDYIHFTGSDADYDPLPDGIYNIRIVYRDRAGNTGFPVTMRMELDTTPPAITPPVATPEQFIPARNTIVFNLFTSEDGYAVLTLSNYQTGLIQGVIASNRIVYTGANDITWDGVIDNRPIATGTYSVCVYVVDENGNRSQIKQGIFHAIQDNERPVVEMLALSTNRLGFAAGRVDEIRIDYVVRDNITKAVDSYVQIVDRYGNSVATIEPYRNAVTNRVSWYGKNDSGAYVADGVYYLRIAGVDEAGNNIQNSPVAKIIVDNSAPRILLFSQQGSYISPVSVDPEAVNAVRLSIKATDGDLMKVRLDVRMNGLSITNVYNSILSNNLLQTFEWNGRRGDRVVADGPYDIVVKITDPSGNETATNVRVVVDTVPPEITSYTNFDDPFSPNNDNLRDYLYIVDRAEDNFSPTISLRYDAADEAGEGIQMQWKASQHNELTVTNYWDGRDNNGQIVPDGMYRLTLSALDLAGNRSESRWFTCEVDTTPPDAPGVSILDTLFSPNGDTNFDVTTVDSTTLATESVWVTHNIEGDTVPYGWTADGSGVYYPATNADVDVSISGRQVNYLTTNALINLFVNNGLQSDVSYSDVTASWSTAIVSTGTFRHTTSQIRVFSGAGNYNNVVFIFDFPQGTDYIGLIDYQLLDLNHIAKNLSVNYGAYNFETKKYYMYVSFYADVSSLMAIQASITANISGTQTFIQSGSGLVNATEGTKLIGTISTNGLASSNVITLSGYVTNGSLTRSGLNVYARTTCHTVTTSPWTTVTNGLYAEYYGGYNYYTLMKRCYKFGTSTSSLIDGAVQIPETFSARWTGYLMPSESGYYTIVYRGRGGIRIYYRDSWYSSWNPSSSAMRTISFDVNLEKNYAYPIILEYSHTVGATLCELYWYTNNGSMIELSTSNLISSPCCSFDGRNLVETNAVFLGSLSSIVSIPQDVLNNVSIGGPIQIVNSNPDVMIRYYNSPTLPSNDISLCEDHVDVISRTDLLSNYVFAQLVPREGYSYSVTPFTLSARITNSMSGLTNAVFDYDNPVIAQLNQLPPNSVITQIDVRGVQPWVAISDIETNFAGLVSFRVSNTYSEPFAAAEVGADNHAISYNISGGGNTENVFDRYSYPSGYDGDFIRMTNWNIRLFTYVSNGVRVAADNLYVSNLVTSLITGSLPWQRNGHFEVFMSSLDNLVYANYRTDVYSTNGEAYSDVWNGVNRATGLVMPDGVVYSKIYTRDRAYNNGVVVNSLEIDNTKPLLDILFPRADETLSNMIDIVASISDKHLDYYTIAISNNGTEYPIVQRGVGFVSNETVAQFDTLGLANGRSLLFARCVDTVSNINRVSIPFWVTNDLDKIFCINNISNKVLSSNGNLIVGFFYKDIDLMVELLNGSGETEITDISFVGQGNSTFAYRPVLPDGTYNLRFTATYSGNSVTRTVRFTVDNIVPSLAIDNPDNGMFVGGVLDIVGSVLDPNLQSYSVVIVNKDTGVSVPISQGSVPVISGRIGVFNTTGINANSPLAGARGFDLVLTASDVAGNKRSITNTFKVDNAKPFVDIIAGNNRLTARLTPATIQIVVQDANIAGARVGWMDNGSFTEISNIINVSSNYTGIVAWDCRGMSGEEFIRLLAYDLAGNTNSVDKTFVIDNTPPVIDNICANDVANRLEVSADLEDNDELSYYEIGVYNGADYVKYIAKDISTNCLEIDYDSDFINLVEGMSYELSISVKDLAGNETQTNIPFVVDRTQPYVAILSPVEGTVIGGSIEMSGLIKDANVLKYTIQIDGSTVKTVNISGLSNAISETLDISLLNDGAHVIALTAYDRSGNVNTDYRNIIVDNTSPVVSLRINRTASVIAGTIEWFISIRDNNPQTYRLFYNDNGIHTIASNSMEETYNDRYVATFITTNLNGVFSFTVEGIDKAGNSASSSIALDIDNTAPQIAINHIYGNNFLGGNEVRGDVSLGLHLQDAHAMDCMVFTSKQTNTEYLSESSNVVSLLYSDLLPEGMNNVTVRAFDSAGNVNTLMTNIFVDRTPPSINVEALPENYSPNSQSAPLLSISIHSDEKVFLQTVQIEGTNSSHDYVSYYLDEGILVDENYQFVWNGRINDIPLDDGNYRLFVAGIDGVSNAAQAYSGIIKYRNDAEPPDLFLMNVEKEVSPNVSYAAIEYAAVNETGYDMTNLVISSLWIEKGQDVIAVYLSTNTEGQLSIEWNGIGLGGETFEDGSYNALLVVADMVGNASSTNFEIVVDSQLPQISNLTLSAIKISANSPTINSSAISAIFKDNESVEYVVYAVNNGQTVMTNITNDVGSAYSTASWLFNYKPQGNYTILLRAVDTAGNSTIMTTNIVVDNTAPRVSMGVNGIYYIDITNEQIYVSTNFTLTLSCSDSDLENIYWDIHSSNSSMVLKQYTDGQTLNFDIYSNGCYELVTAAVDDVDNWMTNKMYLFIDGDGPDVSIVYSTNTIEPLVFQDHKYISFTNSILVSASDDTGIMNLTLRIEGLSNAVDIQTNWLRHVMQGDRFSFADFGLFDKGEYRITVETMDYLSNFTLTADLVNLPLPDTTPPISHLEFAGYFTTNGNTVYASSNVQISITATDLLGENDGYVSGVDYIEYQIDGSDWTTYTLPLRFVENGDYLFVFRAVDKVGNREDAHQYTVIINNTRPAVLELKSLVLYHTNVFYEWKLATNTGAWIYEVALMNTNFATNAASALLENISLNGTQLPLRVVGRVRPWTQYGVPGEWMSVTNYLDHTIDMIQPTSNDYYRMAIPVDVEFDSRFRSTKTISTYRLGEDGVIHIPEEWTVIYDTVHPNNRDEVRLLVQTGGWHHTMDDGKYIFAADFEDTRQNRREDSRIVYVDNTRPIINIYMDNVIQTNHFASGNEDSTLTLIGVDPVVNGVASGIQNTWYRIIRIDNDDFRRHHRNIINELGRVYRGSLNDEFRSKWEELLMNRHVYRDDSMDRFMRNWRDDRRNEEDDDINCGLMDDMIGSRGFVEYADPIRLTEGYYIIIAVSADKAVRGTLNENQHGWRWGRSWFGNYSTPYYLFVEIKDEDDTTTPPPADTTPPVVTITGVTNSQYYNHNVNVKVSVSDAALAGSRVLLDNELVSGNSIPVHNDGTHTIEAAAWDRSGNTNRQMMTFTIDKTKPVITVSGLDDNDYTGRVEFSYDVDEINLESVVALIDNKPFTGSSLDVTNDGDHQLKITAVDKAGNTTTLIRTFTVIPVVDDHEPPVITISGFEDGWYYRQNVTLSITVEDENLDIANTVVRIDGKEYTLNNGRVNLTIKTEGEHTVYVLAMDTSLNTAGVQKVFTIDKTPPVISIDNIFEDHCYLTMIPEIRVTDNISGDPNLTEYLKVNPTNTLVYTNWLITQPGGYQLIVTAGDQAGNTTTKKVDFNIVTDFEGTMTLYSSFNRRDAAYVPYGISSAWLVNSTNKPWFTYGSSDQAMIANYKQSVGVVYKLQNNTILNPYRATVVFDVKINVESGGERCQETKFIPDCRMTLFEVLSNTTAVLELYIDPTEGTVIQFRDMKYYLDRDVRIKWFTYEDIWKQLRIEYDFQGITGQPYVKFYVNGILMETILFDENFNYIPLIDYGKIFIGFGENDIFDRKSQFIIDEFRIYEDIGQQSQIAQ